MNEGDKEEFTKFIVGDDSVDDTKGTVVTSFLYSSGDRHVTCRSTFLSCSPKSKKTI